MYGIEEYSGQYSSLALLNVQIIPRVLLIDSIGRMQGRAEHNCRVSGWSDVLCEGGHNFRVIQADCSIQCVRTRIIQLNSGESFLITKLEGTIDDDHLGPKKRYAGVHLAWEGRIWCDCMMINPVDCWTSCQRNDPKVSSVISKTAYDTRCCCRCRPRYPYARASEVSLGRGM